MRITNQEVERIKGQLRSNDIAELDLSDQWGFGSWKDDIARLLGTNWSVRKLKCASFGVGNSGVVTYANALKSNTSIVEVIFTGNPVGDRGAFAFADALKVNSTIAKLDLRGSQIEHRGGLAIADGMKNNRGLIALDVSRNRHTPMVVEAFGEMLKVNSTLGELNLGDVQCYEVVLNVNAYAEAFKINRSLTRFKAEGFSQETVTAFEEALLESGNKNIILFDLGDKFFRKSTRTYTQEREGIDRFCRKNRDDALTLSRKIHSGIDSLSIEELHEAGQRKAAIVDLSERELGKSRTATERLLEGIDATIAKKKKTDLATAIIPLIEKIAGELDGLSINELQEIQKKMPDIISVMSAPEGEYALPSSLPNTPKERAGILIRIQDIAANFGIGIELPKNFNKEFLARELLSTYKLPDQEPDFSYLTDPKEGPHLDRMKRAVGDIDAQVVHFDEMLKAIKASIAEMVRTEIGLIGQTETLNKDTRKADIANAKTDRKIEAEGLRIKIGEERLQSEMAGLLAATAAAEIIANLTGAPLPFLPMLSRVAFRYVSSSTAEQGDRDYRQQLIAVLEAEKVDVAPYYKAIEAINHRLIDIAKSKPIMDMQANKAGLTLLFKGQLRRQMLTQGLENSENLAYFAGGEGISLDDFKGFFWGRVGHAIDNFSYGFADSDDLHVIITYADTLTSEEPSAAQRALKTVVEELIKPAIADIIPKSSRVDVIKDVIPDFFPGAADPTVLRIHVDAASLQAMGALVRANFSTVGGRAIDEAFAFNLHRHGADFLRATRVNDGLVIDVTEPPPKAVVLWTDAAKREFTDRVTHSYRVGRVDLPAVDNLFLRICAYEYFRPQAVDTSGRDNTFAQNPQAPTAYPMVNNVVTAFVGRMGFKAIEEYRQLVGDRSAENRLDHLTAQSFIDFFAVLGQQHANHFAIERQGLSSAHDNGTYGSRYRMYARKITDDALSHFDVFAGIFKVNLQRTLEISQTHVREQLLSQMGNFKEAGKVVLGDTAVIMPGTQEALDNALTGPSRRFRDMRMPELVT